MSNVEGWLKVPTIGTLAKANHPITVLNPTKVFEVTRILVEGSRIYAGGKTTMNFHVNMLSEPTSEEIENYLTIKES